MNFINLDFQVEYIIKSRTGFLEDGFFLKDKTFLGRYPILASLAKTRSPSLGSVKRQISLKSVDLPVPLGPIKPIRSFLLICKETLSKMALLPKARLTLSKANHFTPPYTASRYSFQKHSAVRNPASVRTWRSSVRNKG